MVYVSEILKATKHYDQCPGEVFWVSGCGIGEQWWVILNIIAISQAKVFLRLE